MNEMLRRDIMRGSGNAERPLTQTLWERDSREPVTAMVEPGNYEPDNPQINFHRYFDRDYAARELKNVWLKQWILAARDEDIPNVGDRVPLQIGPASFFIVRSGEDEFKAFYNSCLHRGTELCSKAESADTIRCPYHAWEWHLDGRLKGIPSHWDFTAVKPKNGGLREVRVGRWDGFIFINADPAAPPLEEAMSVIPEHFKAFGYKDRYTASRFRKLVPANWKIVQEAFLEAYHVVGTHPGAIPYNGDSQAKYDIWESENGHVVRQVTPSAVPSMHAGPEATSLVGGQVYATIMRDWHYPDAELPELDPEKDIRTQIGDWHREVFKQRYGRENESPDAVMIDNTLYFMFPQATFWLTESLPFIYQFLPHPSDPELSYFDVRLMLPVPAGEERPPSSPIISVGIDERIHDRAPAFNFLAIVFDQDMDNMPLVQRGMKSADPTRFHSQLGTYQEMGIQHWNQLFDRCMAE